MNRKNTLFITFAAVLSLMGGLFVQSSFSKGSLSSSSKTSLIEFSLPDLSGKQRNINEWQGKIRIINFWATWCPPCLKEIPDFIKLQNEFNSQGLQFIGIAIDNPQSVQNYIDSININYPILIGEDKAIGLSHQLGNIINAVPFTVIINQQGDIVHRQPGELSRKKIIEIISPLIF